MLQSLTCPWTGFESGNGRQLPHKITVSLLRFLVATKIIILATGNAKPQTFLLSIGVIATAGTVLS
jgi:hypothetical protein